MLERLALLWPPQQARRALQCLPALALVLFGGVLLGHPGGALVAGSGALSVGFGSFFPDTMRHRGTPMLLAGVGMAISAGVGSLVGHSLAELLALSVLWSVGCAWLIAFGVGAWWIVLQWAVGLFVSSAYGATLPGAATRTAMILLGAAVQFAAISAFWSLGVLAPPTRVAGAGPAGYPGLALAKLRSGQNNWPYVAAAGLTVGIGVFIERGLSMPNGYWVPMTSLIVMRPDLRQTWSRVLQRVIGTLFGAGLISLLAEALRPAPLLIAGLMLLFTWSAYASRGTHYGLFSASITGTVVLLLSLTGRPESLNALHRVLATLLGALLVVCVRAGMGISIPRAAYRRT
jgi:Fusaric acid resistance protein-like